MPFSQWSGAFTRPAHGTNQHALLHFELIKTLNSASQMATCFRAPSHTEGYPVWVPSHCPELFCYSIKFFSALLILQCLHISFILVVVQETHLPASVNKAVTLAPAWQDMGVKNPQGTTRSRTRSCGQWEQMRALTLPGGSDLRTPRAKAVTPLGVPWLLPSPRFWAQLHPPHLGAAAQGGSWSQHVLQTIHGLNTEP